MAKVIKLNESQEKLLMEFLSSILYHFTDEDKLEFICSNNKIPLTKYDSYFTNNKQNDEIINKGYPFYLSFTRVKNSNVGFGSWRFTDSIVTVRIEINGDKLNNNFKGKPVDYFKVKGTTNDFRFVQSEDRLFSRCKFIENADKYINRIDILLNDLNDINWLNNFKKEKIDNTVFKNKVVIYLNKEDFDFQK